MERRIRSLVERKQNFWSLCLLISLSGLLTNACGVGEEPSSQKSFVQQLSPKSAHNAPEPCAVALAPQGGDDPIDQKVSRLQQEARTTANPVPVFERLGWLFVSKARLSHDTGYYKLAEQSALCLESKHPDSPGAALLRGHVMHNLHRFTEAESLARELVAIREAPFDYGLLGDALMEQGRLDDATDAYQRMVDLKPSLHSYSRIAHLQWLKGDLEGAIQLLEMAGTAASPRDPESAAWVYTRLALYRLQAGVFRQALNACDVALGFQTEYAPALLARGRILFAQKQVEEAIEALSKAASLNPLPEYQWWLADALRAAGRSGEASRIENRLKKRGAAEDSRTLSLYLATRGEDALTAVRLAEQELETRKDVFTLDALAWSLKAAGRVDDARAAMKQALEQGTEDARLFFHAGIIARAAGEHEEAVRWLTAARSIEQMLLPSERDELDEVDVAARSITAMNTSL